MGRKPALPEEVENKIVDTLKVGSKQGIGTMYYKVIATS